MTVITQVGSVLSHGPCTRDPGSHRGHSNVMTRMGAEAGVMCFEDRRRVHILRNRGSHQKPEKAEKQMFPSETSEETSTTNTSPLAQGN